MSYSVENADSMIFFSTLCEVEKSNRSCPHLDLSVCPHFKCAQHKEGEMLWSSSLSLPDLLLCLCITTGLQLCLSFLFTLLSISFCGLYLFFLHGNLKNSYAPDLALQLSTSSNNTSCVLGLKLKISWEITRFVEVY